MRVVASPLLLLVLLCACSSPGADGRVGASRQAIENGTPAYPEAVVVTPDFPPAFPLQDPTSACSGVLVAPRVVLTAGHCQSVDDSYTVLAPNVGNESVTASSDWTSFTGDAAKSSDTLLIFLDSPIELESYPQIASAPVAAGTGVVDIGRVLNGTVTQNDYVSPPVTIQGLGTSLGFPFNYQALPDISQDGDSGGPIEVEVTDSGSSAHLVVAIIDQDTTSEGVSEQVPIDLPARVDVIYDEIEKQIGAHGGLPSAGDAGDGAGNDAGQETDGGAHGGPPSYGDGSDEPTAEGGGAPSGGSTSSEQPPATSGQGCSVCRGRVGGSIPSASVTGMIMLAWRRRRRGRSK